MDLDGVADELYAAAPEDFVGRRSARVAEARAAKGRELAAAIGALRRPTRSAWLVNQLAREGAAELAELLDLGEALAQAQRDAAGPELRRLSAQRHAAVDALVRRAVEVGSDHDHQASEATRTEVGQILTAALADPSLAGVVRAGRVTQAVAYGGFGPDLVLGSTAKSALTPPTSLDERRAAKRSASKGRTAEEQADERRRAATDAAEKALRALEHARAVQEDVEAMAEAATQALETAEEAVTDARHELATQEKARDRAQRSAKDADRRAGRARADAEEAEQAAARAAAELRGLET